MPATDRPDDATIDDDERLDRWFAQFQRDQARRAAKHGGRRGGSEESARAQAIQIFTPEQVQQHQQQRDAGT